MPLGMVLADAINVRLWAAGEAGTPGWRSPRILPLSFLLNPVH